METLQYTTLEKFKSHVGEEFFLTHCIDTTTGETNAKLLIDTNSDAVAEAESYLRGKYELPVADKFVSVIVCDIMKFRLFKRRDEANIPDNIIALYRECVKSLEKIKSRKLILSVTAPENGESASPVKSTIKFTTSPQKFGAGFTGF